jgi:uncharacterized protein
MLFKRRNRAGLRERLRVWAWPRVSWRRSWTYYVKRALRLSATPHAIAAGMAAGAFASFTPFVGFHFMIAFLVAFIIRGNLVAGAIGTAVGNPLTFPLIWAATYQFGQLMLRGESRAAPRRLADLLMEHSVDQIWPLIKPMIVGGIPMGIVAGAVCYFLTYKTVAAYQTARRERLAGLRARLSRSGEPEADVDVKALKEAEGA